MRSGMLMSAAVLLFAVAGCAAVPPGAKSDAVHAAKAKALACKPSGACTVKVWVECPGASAPCAIRVDNEFVVAFEGAKPQIAWEITKPNDPDHPTPARFRFAPNDRGIVFPADASGEFSGCRSSAGDRTFGCKDQQSEPGPVVWKYTIAIVDADGLLVVDPLDPWVINL